MKEWFIKVVCLFLVILLLDWTIGVIMNSLRVRASGGETARTEYICNKTDAQILVMGSSRAAHHYDPNVIENKLGKSCYNCGYDGCGIIVAFSQLQLILERYEPEIIIYELTPSYDYIANDNSRFLKVLRPYCYNSSVREVVESIDNTERYKLLSQAYRYNSVFVSIALDYFRESIDSLKGYKPEFKVLDYEPEFNSDFQERCDDIDELKAYYLSRFIEICSEHSIKLSFVISPIYQNRSNVAFQYGIEQISAKGISVYDLSCDTMLTSQVQYFSDAVHLNASGARVFSEVLCSKIDSSDDEGY